jgi:VanZ family protein
MTLRGQGTWRRIALAWLPVLAWAALIVSLSAQSSLRFVPDAAADFIIRKVGHAGVFGILSLLVWRGLEMTTRMRWPWLAAVVITAVYAASDEFHQGFVAGRYATLMDVSIDTAGAIIAVLVVGAVLRRWRRRASASAVGE